MADRMTIDVDAQEVLQAFDRFPELLAPRVKAVALVTSERVKSEAHARVRRRTGATADHIVVIETQDGTGYIVWVDPSTRTPQVTFNAVGRWLEFGTFKMEAHPFLFSAAQLEEDAHRRRIEEATQDAIEEAGLGG